MNLLPTCLLGLSLAASQLSPAQTNLVPNGNFEQITDGKLSGWIVGETNPPASIPAEGSVQNAKGVTYSLDEGSAGPGSHSVKMQASGTGNDYGLLASPRFPILGGFDYEMSAKYRAQGFIPENVERTKHSAFKFDLFLLNPEGKQIGGARIMTHANTEAWVTVNQLTTHTTRFTAPVDAVTAVARPQITNQYEKAPMTLWIDDITLAPLDPDLANPGFETGQGGAPESWKAFGAAQTAWTNEVAHGGKYSVSVTDAPDGLFSGWSTVIPVRDDRSYVFSGFAKGGVLNPNGFIGGGALEIQFLDASGQPLGDPIVSPAVGANADWTEIATPKARPPVGAAMARLTAGLRYTNGTAWFDDLSLIIDQVASRDVAKVRLDSVKPSEGVVFAKNLLPNGDIELGTDTKPTGWTYVGKSDPDWTPEEIQELHTKGRPEFKIGRGRGEWSRDTVYSGNGALLNISIDPPLSRNHQWYGRNPVDGFWLSESMPAEPGKSYIASGWIRPGRPIESAWFGPLEIRFYDKNGRQLDPAVKMRPGMGDVPAGVWSFYATLPYVAPEGTASMRLRFGQEFIADKGGWGRSYADNLAVWEVPAGAPAPDYAATFANTAVYKVWFNDLLKLAKPPYAPAPAEAEAYESVWGVLENSVPGNLYYDPASPIAARFSLTNLLGEDHEVSLRIIRYDSFGTASEPIVVDHIKLKGGEQAHVPVELPPSGQFGAFYLDAEILAGDAPVGKASGRYAVLPSLKSEPVEKGFFGGIADWWASLTGGSKAAPMEVENVFGVTPLVQIFGDNRPFEQELGEMLKVGGFGVAWVRLHYQPTEADVLAQLEPVKKELEWYQSLGLRTIVQLGPKVVRPVTFDEYEKIGRLIARELKGKTNAIGNWGVEQANSKSPYRGGGKDRFTDEEYDTIVAAQYAGIKAEAPEMTVLTGNIATDFEADTIKRLYKEPAKGAFDGFVMNAYMGALGVASNGLKAMDAQGDTAKTVWWEEQANQRSPYEGDGRRYGEIDGAREMVRTWLTLIGKLGTRLQAVTMWGFVLRSEADIMMVTPNLQPRPQYAAHTVMAAAVKGLDSAKDHSANDMTIFEWQRPDGPLFVAWANAGERDLTLEVPSGKLIVTDIFGNQREEKAVDGVVTLRLDSSPVYLTGGGQMTISRRIETSLKHGSQQAGPPVIELSLRNNDKKPIEGEIIWTGELQDLSSSPFQLEPGKSLSLTREVKSGLPQGDRSTFRAEIKTATGATYSATASMNFAQAVRVPQPPSLDGTWTDWQKAEPVVFGSVDAEVEKRLLSPDVEYGGTSDILGKLRMMWDDSHFYLGVEALDDKFVAQPKRNSAGFMGDSIEFGVQPQGALAIDAPHWEFELYLPEDGTKEPLVTRRFPIPTEKVTTWKTSVTPTGTRGDVNYQLAIPWQDLGIDDPAVGKTFTLAMVLNDGDRADRLDGKRKRILWFRGVDGKKNPLGFGDVTLVN